MGKIQQNILIDTDMGNDDIMAICLMLQNPDLNIVAISTVNGVSNEIQGAQNLQRIFEYLGYSIPIFIGSSNKSFIDFPTIDCTRAENLTLLRNIPLPLVRNNFSDFSSNIPAFLETENLSIVALGPLTNIANLVTTSESTFIKNSIPVIMMGGGITKGNVPPDYIAEYNIALDPKSAAVVFDSRVPVTMIGIDATQYVPCTSKFKESVKDITPQGKIGTIIKSIIMNNTNDFSDFYDPLVSFYLSETSSFSSIKGKLESSCKTSTYGKTTLTQNSTKDTVITRVIPESFYSYLQTSLI